MYTRKRIQKSGIRNRGRRRWFLAGVLVLATAIPGAASADDAFRHASAGAYQPDREPLVEPPAPEVAPLLRSTLTRAFLPAGIDGIGALAHLFDQTAASPDIWAPVLLKPLPRLTRRPVPGRITSEFGTRDDPIRRGTRDHNGLDFHAQNGTPVVTAGAGVVRRARRVRGYGNLVDIDHGLGFSTRYAHLSAIEVHHGERVVAGQRIGRAGATGRTTGPHLHFEVRLNQRPVDPLLAVPVLTPKRGILSALFKPFMALRVSPTSDE